MSQSVQESNEDSYFASFFSLFVADLTAEKKS
jgi:hypothetical protein